MIENKRPVVNSFVALREEFDDWAILFNPDTSDAVGINPVGVAVWKLMDGRSSLEEIVTKVRDCFGDVPDVADKDIQAFVEDLAGRGFVGYEVGGIGQ